MRGDGLETTNTVCSLLCPALCSLLLRFKPPSPESNMKLQGKRLKETSECDGSKVITTSHVLPLLLWLKLRVFGSIQKSHNG